MQNHQPRRRALQWIASLTGAAIVATFGATAVLAEGPTCIAADGTPITQEQAAADASLCPSAPAPEPESAPEAPADPVPAPEAPAPEAETPAEPAPEEPAPEEPAAEEPAPAEPAPETPAEAEPGAEQPVDDQQPAGDAADDDATTPPSADPVQPTPATPVRETTKQQPSGTQPSRPVREAAPIDATPKPKPSMRKPRLHAPAEAVHEFAQAKIYQTAPFRDARLFREQYDPEGRIPEQPQMDEQDANAIFDGAEASGTRWPVLAAVAWIESRWGDPSAGALVGKRLSPQHFEQFGTDGDGDGAVEEINPADRAATLGALLASHDTVEEGLRTYYVNTRREVVAERTAFLADYFGALGKLAVVRGLEDPEVRERLAERLLANEDVLIYDGGRSDIDAGLVDPRLIVTLEFLQRRFNTVTVSSLISGHGVYTASGNVSLHSYGQAVDIAALDGESILGNQHRGSNTERAVKELLLLPESMQSAELISLWDLGMPSFALSDHHDHIHIGWKTEVGPAFGGGAHDHD